MKVCRCSACIDLINTSFDSAVDTTQSRHAHIFFLLASFHCSMDLAQDKQLTRCFQNDVVGVEQWGEARPGTTGSGSTSVTYYDFLIIHLHYKF